MENIINSILIVDDTPKNLQVLGNTLKLEKYKVEFAINGFQALDWIGKKDFDLILLDVMMPEMDGYEVCQKIRSNEKNKNLPIIFLTAKTDSDSIVKGFEIGAQDYITKPFNTSELLVRVKTQLELKNSRSKLESMNQWLEEEVKKRTLELEDSNTKLEKANSELLGLDKAKTEFLTLISNQIRTPLNGILGTLHILKDKIDSIEMVNLLNVLDSSVNKLEKFSSNALLLTSLRANKYKLNIEDVDLAQAIDFSLLELSKNLKENKVKINNNIPDGLIYKADNTLFITAIKGIITTLIGHAYADSSINLDYKLNSDNKTITMEVNGKPFSVEQLSNDLTDLAGNEKTFGLELVLAKLIIETHGATMHMQNFESKLQVSINWM